MGSLHRKPTANNGLIHNITPENADWRYVGFDLYKLSPGQSANCLLYTSPSPRDKRQSRMPSSA